MKIVYARDAEGKERRLAFVRREEKAVMVCPIEKFNREDEAASLEFAVGFPVDDIRDGELTN